MREEGEHGFEFLSGELGLERCDLAGRLRRGVVGSVGGAVGVKSRGGRVEVGEGNSTGREGAGRRDSREILMPFMWEAMAWESAGAVREESESSRDRVRAERDAGRALFDAAGGRAGGRARRGGNGARSANGERRSDLSDG